MSARSAPTRDRASAAARLILPLAAVALLFACSDAPSTAPARAPDVPNVAAPPRATKGEEVTITRTTEIALTPRGLKGERSSSRRVKRFGRELHQVDRDQPARALPRAETPHLDELPPAGLSVTAMPVMLHNAGQRWTRRGPVQGEPGVTVESEGMGDRPADVLRFRRDGVLLFTIRQEYERRGGHWALRHRETVAADGHFRDVVDAQWSGTPVEDGAVATRHLLGQMGRVRAPAQHPATTLAALVDDSDCCQDKVLAADAAFQAFLFADATALAICAMTPPPADLLACVVATGKAVEKYVEFTQKANARDACLLNPPKCHEEEVIPTEGSGGTSTGGGINPDPGLVVCWYEYWYDIDTGEVMDWQFLYCERMY